MDAGQTLPLLVIFLLAVFVLIILAKSVPVVPAGKAGIVERLGKYKRTLDPGLAVIVPLIDKIRFVDLREQVLDTPPKPAITKDNHVADFQIVIYYQVVDPETAGRQSHDPDHAIEQLTTTTLREVVGRMSLERALTSVEQVNHEVRTEMDKTTGEWGIRVNRVEGTVLDAPRIRATVRRLQSPDADLETFVPADPEDVGIVVQVIAGPADGQGEEAFDVVVCAPRWLERQVREKGLLVGRHHLIVERFDLPRIRHFLTTVVESGDARTWQELAERIGRLGKRRNEVTQTHPSTAAM